MKKIPYTSIVMLIFFLGSCKEIDFQSFDTDAFYCGKLNGKEVVVNFSKFAEGDVKGVCYVSDEALASARQAFSMNVNARGIGQIWTDETDGEDVKLKLQSSGIRVSSDSYDCVLHKLSHPDYFQCSAISEDEICDYALVPDITYANAEGYWTSYPETAEDFAAIYMNRVGKLVHQSNQELKMDIYCPVFPDTTQTRPLLMLIHGGAFYNGDKESEPIVEWSKAFAKRGYVVAAINYRLGFRPLKADIERAGFRAVQDAHAAMRYLVHNAETYHINTDYIFVGGSSAGAITALNLAFMRDENRPASTKGVIERSESEQGFFSRIVQRGAEWLNLQDTFEKLGLTQDLGGVGAVNSSLCEDFQIKGVINMWGALNDITMLENSKQTDILSFHGTADRIVAYDYDYPFRDVFDEDDETTILGTLSKIMSFWEDPLGGNNIPLNELVFSKMYGSKCIDDNALNYGINSELHSVQGGGHSLQVEDNLELSDYFYTIQDTMSSFMHRECVPYPVRLEQSAKDGRVFELLDATDVTDLYWKVEGGVILDHDSGSVKVLFFGDAPKHSVIATGKYKNGLGFCLMKEM